MEYAQKLFSTRGGTIALAGIAALIAGVAVFIYVHNYRDSVKSGGFAATVLVAKSLIPQGTPGSAIATRELYQGQSIRQSQLRDGAIADPAALRGKVAARDIFPGQQLTLRDFKTSSGTLASTLAGRQRAITIPIDGAHGIIGNLHVGDRIDVYAGFNVISLNGTGQAHAVLRLIMQNVQVADLSGSGNRLGGSGTSHVTLRTSPKQSAKLAFASDNGRIWLVLRPPTGGRSSPPSFVTVETEVLGIPPLTVIRALGGRQ